MKVLVVANASPVPRDVAESMAAWADRVVGADGGATRWREAGQGQVDLAVGDFDSIAPEDRRALGTRAVVDEDPDHTDLDKALGRVVGDGAAEVRVVGATGGRLDHQMGVWGSLARAPAGVPVSVWDAQFEVRAVRGSWEFAAREGARVSLFAVDGPARVRTRGLKWPLTADQGFVFSGRGVDNLATGPRAAVEVVEGCVLAFRARRGGHEPRTGRATV